MKNNMRKILSGNGNLFNGLIALTVLGLFVLGCNCNKLTERSSNPTNTYPTNNGTAPATPMPKQKATIPTNSTGQLPSPEETEAIIQETIQDFATGVDGDFSAMYDKSSKGFKRTYTLDSVKTNFIAFVNQKSRVVPALRSTATMTPNYSLQPAVSKEKGLNVLRAHGGYSSSPTSSFELEYVLEDKRWKMIGIRIKMQ